MSVMSTPTQPEARVLAFDPGFERLGVAVIEKNTLLYSSCLRTLSTLPFPQRLEIIGMEAERLITRWHPTSIALEEIYFEKNAKTAMQIAQVRGVLAYTAARHRLTLYAYTPLQIKLAVTGYGKSGKAAVATMVERLITLPKRSRLDDEIDAIAIALTCLASARYPHTSV